MSRVSPQAQAVFQACSEASWDWSSMAEAHFSVIAVAALRAAASVLPIQELTREPPDAFEQGLSQGQALAREELLAWADEIELGR